MSMLDIMVIEHHDNFTAVYMYGQLAFMCLVGTKEQREGIPESTWQNFGTWAASDD